jgi:hypothetical protein
MTNEGAWVQGFIRILEPQRREAPHYHLLAATSFSMEPDSFDWEAFLGAAAAFKAKDQAEGRRLTRQYAKSTSPEVRAAWKLLKEALPKYGFGRSEFVPVRKGGEAVVRYAGKYLEAGLRIRVLGWKHARRVECDRRTSQQWRRCGRQFAWVSPRAQSWRQRVGELGQMAGVDDIGGMTNRFGRRWAYRFREYIIKASATEWPVVCGVLASQQGSSR